MKKKSARIKLELLTNGINIQEDLDLKSDEAEEKFIYDSYVPTKVKIPSEIILPGNVISNVFLTQNSSWEIRGRTLFFDGEEVSKIKFTPESKFSRRTLSDGTLASNIGAMFGLEVLGIFVNRFCFFPKIGAECHFCSSAYTQRKAGNKRPKNLTILQLQETLQLALDMDNELFDTIMLTSGAYENPDFGIEEQLKYINGMKQVANHKTYHLVTLPPKSLDLITELAERGPDTIAFDIEVFDPLLFRKYCSGKNLQFGYDGMLERFEYAARVFPRNTVKAGFVCGLEPPETLIKGMEFFGKLGISSSLNIFHPDRGTQLSQSPRPSKSYLMEVIAEQNKINKKFGLIPIFPKYGRRSSLDTEVYRGCFDDL